MNSNCFWKLIYALHGQAPSEDYDEKWAFLLEHNFGVWYVLHYANRSSAADIDINNAVPNDFNQFFIKHPHIKSILFNGKEAEERFRKSFPTLFKSLRHEKVLSSSGVLARPFEDKLENWRTAINRLNE